MGRVAGLTAEDTRARLVAAAAKEFAEHGFEGARTAQIAAAAGLSAGAMYNHFASKAELLAAVVESHAAVELNELLVREPNLGLLDLLASEGNRLQKGKRSASLLVEVIQSARRDPEVAAMLAREVGARESLISDALELAQSAGHATSDVSPDAIARFTLMVALGSLLVRAMNLPPVDNDEWTALISRLLDAFRPSP
jgi:AcrR family transcriptional regulator